MTMTVKDLIEELEKLPQDALVLGRGNEEGYDPIRDAILTEVIKFTNNEWWRGDYDPFNKEEDDPKDKVTAVLLS